MYLEKIVQGRYRKYFVEIRIYPDEHYWSVEIFDRNPKKKIAGFIRRDPVIAKLDNELSVSPKSQVIRLIEKYELPEVWRDEINAWDGQAIESDTQPKKKPIPIDDEPHSEPTIRMYGDVEIEQRWEKYSEEPSLLLELSKSELNDLYKENPAYKTMYQQAQRNQMEENKLQEKREKLGMEQGRDKEKHKYPRMA